MSTSSYRLLNNSTDKIDVDLSVKEPTSSAAMNHANLTLRKRFIQITFAVTLYWYGRITL